MSTNSRVAVAICTCNRPDGLRKALNATTSQVGPGEYTIIVVDNHDSRSGLRATKEFQKSWAGPLIAVHEEKRGIAHARNRALHEARTHDIQFVAFLDDDEIPSRQWLDELLATQTETGADIVGGPVLPLFSQVPTTWAVRSGYYAQQYPLHYGRLLVNSTANVLLRMDAVHAVGDTPFDADFGLTGGSDHILFWEMANRGSKMAWSQMAVVFEEVPPERLESAWVLQRAYRNGNINVRAQRRFQPGWRRELLRLAKTTGLAAAGMIQTVLLLLAGRDTLEGRIKIHKAAGKLAAHFGSHYLEYARRHA